MPRRSEVVSQQNARIAAAARAHHFGDRSPVPFVCECDDHDCREFVTLTLPEYALHRRRSRFLVAPGHAVPRARREVS